MCQAAQKNKKRKSCRLGKSAYEYHIEAVKGMFEMKTRIVLDGNAFYEIDEECLQQKMRNTENEMQKESALEKEKYKIPQANPALKTKNRS